MKVDNGNPSQTWIKIDDRGKSRVENVIMKYITFLVRVMVKPTKGYFELKKYISKEKSLSLYFELISSVLSERIEANIEYA